MANILVFDNGSFVDTSNNAFAESDNTQATLSGLGHAVTTVTATDAASLAAALVGQHAFVIPEMENGDWSPAADVIAVIQAFVAAGGTLVIHAYSGSQDTFLNSVFGFSVASTFTSGPFARSLTAPSEFDTEAASLPWNDGTETLSIASLPAGSSLFYDDGANAAMADLPYGSGSILYMGWDWFYAAPAGTYDGGWISAYGAALDATVETNEAPDAVDDELSGTASGVLNIGYYDMSAGQGVASQIEAIVAAGHNAVLITDLSAAELAGIDMLVVQNPSNGGFGGEYVAALADIEAAVNGGLKLIIHDRYVENAESILPGSAGFNIVRQIGAESTHIDFINDAHSVASGPGGSLTDASLDGGNFSNHGFAIGGSLPVGADLILSTNDASHIVTFSYGFGAGHVIYSSIPIDHYLGGDAFGAGADNMGGKAEEYMANLIDYAAVDLSGALTDEDTAVVIDGADLLANDTDPDGDTLTISGVSATSTLGAAVTLNIDGTIDYDPTGALDYLAEGEVVEDTFTYTIDDGNGGTDTATVSFKVVGINDGPSAPVDIDPTGDSLTADATISEHLAVGSNIGIEADSTDPEGDPVTYYFRDGTNAVVQTLGKFTIDANTGVVTLAAAVNFELETSYTLTIYASDGALESSATFDVEITNVVEHLFTPNNDGTAAAPIDFNALPPGAYDLDGAQYDALSGDDYVYLPHLATSALPGHVWDYSQTFNASAGNDVIQGGDGNDIVSGGDGNDRLFGGDGDDRLVGSSGNDILGGGDGADKMTGSSGRDIFILTDSEIGTTKLGEHDTITDFQQGTDKIDISALYDNGVVYGGLKNGALNGMVSNAYKAGYYTASGKTWLEGDVTGDGVADWVLEMSGSYKLKGSDIVAGQSIIESVAQWNAVTGGLPYTPHHQDDYFIV